MKHFYAFKKSLLFIIGLLLYSTTVQGQFTEWTGSGDWTDPANWSGGYFYGQLEWKGAGSTTSNNDATGGAAHQWRLFFSGSTAYTIIGNEVELFDFGGAPSWVLSDATVDQTLEIDIVFADVMGPNPAWITTRSTGKFILGNLGIGGTVTDLRIASLDTSGEVIVNGDITGSVPVVIGKDELNVTQPTTRVEYMSACTYTGATVIEGGVLTLRDDLASSDVTVKSGANLDIAGNVTIKSLLVESGGAVNITPGNSLIVDGVTDNSGDITLQSASTSFSSYIPDSYTGSGNVIYNRFVNSSTNGNDLIASPLPGESWADFLLSSTNAADLLNDGMATTTYAFAPFDKSVSDYVNFTSATSTTLDAGRGYRVATNAGTTLTFTGSPLSGTVSFNIEDTGASFADWNLIGNPYPSYVNMQSFLEHEVAAGVSNISLLESASGIYGYDGDASNGWNVITLANDDGKLFAPGQGFFVAADAADVLAHDVEFTAAMRSSGTSDDFIVGRTNNTLTFADIHISTANSTYNTEVYFDANASLGLDPGYDATIFGGSAPSFAIYSHLVQDNTGIPMALQAVGLTDLSDVTIPLGVNANVGEELTFSMTLFSLPPNIEVYLDDNDAGISTLLNSGNYVLTPASNLTGVGRFFLRFTDSALSTAEHNFDAIDIYTDQNSKTINISGYLANTTQANVYDLQGRLVRTKTLDMNANLQRIDMSSFTTGIYIIELSDDGQSRVEKVILP
ncbi:T9SS type A sorting domain-containing protein [Winogradskyella sp.]|uniref:T9SS type A sorting domain-containing protein n=1 Tax=Winogradskyella sp. TaxID=1883156 RepID=UPI003BA8C5DD